MRLSLCCRFLLLFAGIAFHHGAVAAESYDSCTGFIDALPATISGQGTWCLRKDLATSIAAGAAITVAANNVTIDCNGFKVGGLGAGNASHAYGISAVSRFNVTVRQCNVRGFYVGIAIYGDGDGGVVEDNRLDQNLLTGIFAYGEHVMVRRNAVYDTGGAPGASFASGIRAGGRILDNIVSGVASSGASGVQGIDGLDIATEISMNRVRGLSPGPAHAMGIWGSTASIVSDNQVIAEDDTTGKGIYQGAFCLRNFIMNFSTGYDLCSRNAGNDVL